jgi:hypothetical protein
LVQLTAAGALCIVPLAAAAQTDAAPPAPPTNDETIHGTVDSLPSHYTLLLRDDRGFVDTVTLRDETVVNPSDLQLTAGLAVTIVGHADGKTFDADEIDARDVSPAAPAPSASAPPQDQPNDAVPYQSAPDTSEGPAYDAGGQDYDYAPPPAPVYVPVYPPVYAAPAIGIVVGGFGFGGFGYYGGYGYGHPYHYGGYGHPYHYGGYPSRYGYGYRAPLPARRVGGYSFSGGSVRPLFAQHSYRAIQSQRFAYSGGARSYSVSRGSFSRSGRR